MKSVLVLTLFLQCIFFINGVQIYVHMMPWFETKATNNGNWGIHWTMANKNPDNIVNGQQDIASWYHPIIGAYASGDPDVIDWQLGLMKAAGIAGVIIDWPGTTNYADYPKNKQNSEAIIAGTQRVGLNFAICYEDNNLNLAGVPNKIAQGTADMQYLQNNYFNKPNYVKINGAPLLLDFGPQALVDGGQWDQVFTPLNPKPTFLTLWYQHQQGGSFNQGEYAWIYSDFMTGLQNWYANVKLPVKIGVAYPGFNTFYQQGGWPGPNFKIDVGVNTFQQTIDLAAANTEIVQIATWNDYGEGTMIEPTQEFQYQFLDIIRQKTGSKYTHVDFEEITKNFRMRKQFANNVFILQDLKQKYQNLVHKFG